jgi:hypothetical protein
MDAFLSKEIFMRSAVIRKIGWAALISTVVFSTGCSEKWTSFTDRMEVKSKTAPISGLDAVELIGAPSARCGAPNTGSLSLLLTYNLNPNSGWEPGVSVRLYADARRNPEIGQEDIFQVQAYPGLYPRPSTQRLNFSLNNVRVGEKILVQGYMCSDASSDCYPSDKDNPPSCVAEIRVLGRFRPSCQPSFTWTGGNGNSGVVCSADCR